MHLYNCAIPQIEFASLSLLHNPNLPTNTETTTGTGTDTTDCCDVDSFIEITTVSSPLSASPPSLVKNALHELHDNLTQSRRTRNAHSQHHDQNSSKSVNQIMNDNDIHIQSATTSTSTSTSFQSLCLQEEEEIFLNRHNNSKFGDDNMLISSQDIQGFTIYHCVMRDANVISMALSLINPFMEHNSGKNNPQNDDLSIVISIGITGMNQLQYTSSHLCNIPNRIEECANHLINKLKKCNSTNEAMTQKQEIELVLTSVLIDDESIKTNEDIELLERGILDSSLQHNKNDIKHKIKLSRSSSKFSLPKKFHFASDKRQRKFNRKTSNHSSSSGDYGTKSDFAATAFLSEATPSSEITRIISDQMQVLSFVEKDMHLKTYGRRHHNNNNNGNTTSTRSSMKGDRFTTSVKSPSRKRVGKNAGSELSGFDYVNRASRKSKSLLMDGNASINFNSLSPSRQSFMTGFNRSTGRQLQNDINSDMMTSISSSTNYTSSTDSITTTASLSSSTSAIPTLSGPSRDSSVAKKEIRRNKIMAASMAHHRSRSWNQSRSFLGDVVAKGDHHSSSQILETKQQSNQKFSNSITPSDFDPFAMEDEVEENNKNSNGYDDEHSTMSSMAPDTTSTAIPTEYSKSLTAQLFPNSSSSLRHADPEGALTSTSSSQNGGRNNNNNNNKTINHTIQKEVPVPIGISKVDNKKSSYIPGSRKLFVNVAMSEDLTCTYRKSKLAAYTVEGRVQILLKSDSTAFVPFTFAMKDVHNYIDTLAENTKLASDMVKQKGGIDDDDDDDDANDTSNNEMGSVYKFIVTMPKADIFFPILKYKCKPALVPVPLRIQSRVRTFLHDCRVALQVSSNPSNQKHLSDITIVMSIPLNVIGETLATQPEGGIFNSEKRSVIWCVSELGSGEKFQLQAQFKLHKTVEEYGEHPSFPISLRCQSLYTHFSGITLECGDIPNTFPADVKSKIARRFRISHKEI